MASVPNKVMFHFHWEMCCCVQPLSRIILIISSKQLAAISISAFTACLYTFGASMVAQLVKNPPAMQETLVQFLGGEDPPGEEIGYPLQYSWASLVTQLVNNLPAMWETWVQSLSCEDALEKGIPTPVFWPGKFHRLYPFMLWRSLISVIIMNQPLLISKFLIHFLISLKLHRLEEN